MFGITVSINLIISSSSGGSLMADDDDDTAKITSDTISKNSTRQEFLALSLALYYKRQ